MPSKGLMAPGADAVAVRVAVRVPIEPSKGSTGPDARTVLPSDPEMS